MNKSTLISIALCILLLTMHGNSQESTSAVKAKFLIEGGIEYGGDEILTLYFTNGSDQTMRAGQGGYLAVGGHFEFTNIDALLLRATIGIKYNTTAADNANIRLTRLPITLIPYYQKNDFRIGVGLTTHQNAKFKGDGFVPDLDFSSTIGPRFEIGYKWVALSYTVIDYKYESDEVFSANSIGLSASFTIPDK